MISRNVPRLRFKIFDDEWKSNKLGNICKIKMGQSPHSKNYTSDSTQDILVQGNADLCDGVVKPRIYTTETTRTANKNDIIMTVRAPVGELAINQFENVVLGRGVAALEGNGFMYNNLKKVDMDNMWDRLSSGSTFKAVNSDDIKSLNVKFPSLPEQQYIGKFFSKLDHLIDLHSQKLEQLKKLKRGYLQKMFPQKGETVPRLRFSGFGGEWKKVKLGDISKCKKGHGLSKDDLSYENDGNKVIHYADIYKFSAIVNKVIHFSNSDEGVKIPKNSLIFPMSDVTPDGLARTSYVNDSNVYAGGDILIFTMDDSVMAKFLTYMINNMPREILRLVTGTSVKHINSKSISSLNIFVPVKSEQEKISDFFYNFDRKIKFENVKIDALKQQKKAHLQKMFI